MKPLARKRFGQNFLVDTQLVERLLRSINPQPGELIAEIGPGHGALTHGLLESGARLALVEIDRDLAAQWQTRLQAYPDARLHCGDALQLDFSEWLEGQPFRLVGNLPYNISTPLLFHVLRWRDLIIDMHFMLQREVVQRMAASPGSKAWGRLSIMCQLHCQVAALFDVPPSAFSPRPKVHSSVVRLLPRKQAPVTIGSEQAFDQVVKQAFAQRRKTLRNSLRGLLDDTAIHAAGIDPGLRPESVDLEGFAALSRQLN